MSILLPHSSEKLKRFAERLTGWQRVPKSEIPQLIIARKPNLYRFRDDGIIPNHPEWPLISYRSPVALPSNADPAAVLEDLFGINGWGDSWRGGIYSYVHYHSRIHEVIGIARGKVKVRFGGNRGRTCYGKAGDVFVLPAGTGHQCLDASKDFMAVGAYPPRGTYDECTRSEDYAKAVKSIAKVGRPRKDPVYGTDGPLADAWT
ncbi:cupin [Taklimakanibacter deserti]|uniref:cupin n=1 Tax=Taklimakanibacter deserti TaxID=2267839 RepID=UPI000E64ADF2